MDIYEKSLAAHKKLRGKLSVEIKDPLETRESLSTFYSPGVGAVSRELAAHPEKTPEYCGTNNSVAIVSDGSAVLGLGNIGPYGALPVMEGKAMLFKRFAGIDGYPVVLNTQDPAAIIAAVEAIYPSYGAINLEDISAPNCFVVEEELKKRLPIPVMHDDQHGTAVVTLAGLINAAKITQRKLADCRIVLLGSGAAGNAIANLLYSYAQPDIVVVDSKGIVSIKRADIDTFKRKLAGYSRSDATGTLADAIKGADIIIGVSKAGLLTADHIRSMGSNPIVFALANPDPEITPDEAIAAGAAVVATGRSDYPNQVNNALAFPGIFRGALDNKVTQITDSHKIAAAQTIASLVENPRPDMIIPSVLEEKLVPAIANVIR